MVQITDSNGRHLGWARNVIDLSNRRKLRPVRIEPYPGEARAISTGAPPDGEFGSPPPGCIDLESPDGSRPDPVLFALALRTRCRHCGRRPGAMWLAEPGGTWHMVTRHHPSCPESVQRRGRTSELSLVPCQPMHGQS